ncbi:aminotransferase class I/II-fold pyridoxal phosphate-dependent enzyme [Streptomyces fimicarius]|uniref:aminotransferase class I/II-fold pyridoxal phosphate-dependent enzyme n=1 Tax=Streptomyces TaxID=1883 RepID=UPI0004AA995F|nr:MULTISPECIES: aminotransferase class I/II-fold pyridoxal phosphate-dependent enzyme [Streptomyces]MCX4712597.1 aminotransferase class I/II-fold pyridoxal phosphate-dependent enzyme [Streptomyces griseus]MDX2671531.1 aminotransferase class I/II-fold pyridoxal phosphate-dependent enzyme [Streptomyces sp. NRRL_ISP-5395]MDX3341953.1 aminotransferase class I/II-fold pyridoxal phosphate-dependent enzyme [Streptomyces sp. ME02-6979.5a]MDX3592624.1 aminotransferase class I/II-fold pyridoxal phosphat
MASAAWGRIAHKLEATGRRVASLESDPERRNSFVPYTAERDTAYVDLDGRRLLMMSGYSYLGLAGDERVVAAAQAAAARYGTGNHGVRALAGSIPLHEELEDEVATVAERESAIVFGSGYAANVGTIGALVGPGDTVFVDKYAHASIVDGCRLSGATVVRFRHNDTEHLARRMEAAAPGGVRLVIVDSVYSMDGDIAPLPRLREVCDAHEALLMADEAHALGVIGRTGLGVEEHFDRRVRVDVKLGTLSKAIPSMGGWVAGSSELIGHLRYAARPFLFSAALAPASAGAALEALRVLRAEPERVALIQGYGARFRELVTAGGMRTGDSETAVVPLIAGSDESAYDLATTARRLGVIGLPVVTPAVPRDLARLRIAVTARHTEADVDLAAEAFLKAAGECGLLTD